MKVSFTGIENITVYKDEHPKEVSFRLDNSQKRTAVADYYGVMVKCDLTDDEDGAHLKEMYDIFRKTSNYYNDSANPTHLTFTTEHFDIHTPSGIIPKDNIKFNSYSIDLNSPSDRRLLPFYTFMAKIINCIMSMSDNKDLNQILQNSNSMISKNAEHFIDEIM